MINLQNLVSAFILDMSANEFIQTSFDNPSCYYDQASIVIRSNKNFNNLALCIKRDAVYTFLLFIEGDR